MMATWQILEGDTRAVLATLPAESVHCVITSPPYFGLRDYGTGAWEGGDPACDHRASGSGTKVFGNPAFNENRPSREMTKTADYQYRAVCGKCGATRVDKQIGLEPAPDAYVQSLVDVFRDVRRVLRPEGVVWLNLGDSYGPGKQLLGIPWRVAFALQADGWWLRSDIVWHKPNAMPESVTDRPTKAHEYIFLLTKSERYFYDAEATKEPVAESTIGRGPVDFGGKKGREYTPAPDDPNYRNGKEQWGRTFDYRVSCATGRNKRTVWTVPTTPFSGAHFATFPPDLIEPMILAGTSARGCCAACGAPWRRVVEREAFGYNAKEGVAQRLRNAGATSGGTAKVTLGVTELVKRSTVGWQPACNCNAGEPVPCTILDPFAGSGTTVMESLRHGRNGIGIELNGDYVKLARNRIIGDAPLFNLESEAVS